MLDVQHVNVDVEQLYHQEHTQYLSWADFKELFSYDENDRSEKDLKRDFKQLTQTYNEKVKFKSLVGKLCHLEINMCCCMRNLTLFICCRLLLNFVAVVLKNSKAD